MIQYYLILGIQVNSESSAPENVLAASMQKIYSEIFNLDSLTFICNYVSSYKDIISVYNKIPENDDVLFFKLMHTESAQPSEMLHSFSTATLNIMDFPKTLVSVEVFRHFLAREAKKLFFQSLLRTYTHNSKNDIVNSDVGVLKVVCDNPTIENLIGFDGILENARLILTELKILFQKKTGLIELDRELYHYAYVINSIVSKIEQQMQSGNPLVRISAKFKTVMSVELEELFTIISWSK